jgi:hypothetical protein
MPISREGILECSIRIRCGKVEALAIFLRTRWGVAYCRSIDHQIGYRQWWCLGTHGTSITTELRETHNPVRKGICSQDKMNTICGRMMIADLAQGHGVESEGSNSSE